MTSKNKERLICGLLFAAGIALCGAAFLVPPLAVLGAGFLAGGLSVLANILQDKDRITVNNNYSNYQFVDNPQTTETVKEPMRQTPTNKLKSLFGFKNKKFMAHHEALLKHETEAIKEIEETESNSMQLPPDILAELNRLNDILQKIDLSAMNKLAQEFEQKSHDIGPQKG